MHCICNFQHPGTLTLSPKRKSARMAEITNGGLTRSGTGRFIVALYDNSGRQRVKPLSIHTVVKVNKAISCQQELAQ